MALMNTIKGFFIGIALVIPGLSGSIFAVVVGLYEKMLDAINHFRQDKKKAIKFLLPIGIGAAIGILASTKIILWVCEAYPIQSYLFFVGLVLGSIPLVLKKMKKIPFKPAYLLISVGALVGLTLLTKLGEGGSDSYIAITSLDSFDDIFTMLFAGGFSVSLMSIPGVSGSIMLMVINQYGTVYHAVGQSVDMVAHMIKGNWVAANEAFQSMLLILPFMVGAVVGIVLVAKLMGYLLKRYEAQVYYGVAGVVVSAMITLFETGVLKFWPATGTIGNQLGLIVIAGVCVVVGIACTIFLDSPEEKETA